MEQKIEVILFQSHQDFPELLLAQLQFMNQKKQTIIKEGSDDLIKKASHIRQWRAIKLHISSPQKETESIKAISDILFPNLILLNLRYNNIICSEALSRLTAPNLQIINLSNNSINNLSSIRKMLSEKISQISLHCNKIVNCDFIAEGNWKNIAQISIDGWISQFFCQHLGFCMKIDHINNHYVYQLVISSSNRINNEPFNKSLKKKYALAKKISIFAQNKSQ